MGARLLTYGGILLTFGGMIINYILRTTLKIENIGLFGDQNWNITTKPSDHLVWGGGISFVKRPKVHKAPAIQ